MASRSSEYQRAGRWRSPSCSQQEEAGLLPPGGLVPDTQSRLCPQIRQRTAAVVSPAPSSWHFWRVVAPRFLLWAQIILLARNPPLTHTQTDTNTHTHTHAPRSGPLCRCPPKNSNMSRASIFSWLFFHQTKNIHDPSIHHHHPFNIQPH